MVKSNVSSKSNIRCEWIDATVRSTQHRVVTLEIYIIQLLGTSTRLLDYPYPVNSDK